MNSRLKTEIDFVEKNHNKVRPLTANSKIDESKEIKLYANDKAGSAGRTKWFVINKDLIGTGTEFISRWKVIVSSAHPGGQENRSNCIEIVDNHSAFGRSRVALGVFETQEEAQNFYIPPQKTNQIFTPKVMVKKMVDMLEQENPGCFDDPDKTFIDLYMKSGLYITEIVKRLYQSKEMTVRFPDPKERLRHIFEKQVYGLAPTEIIYRIALAYILGFDETSDIEKHNFRQLDALPYAKEGTLSEKLDELFG